MFERVDKSWKPVAVVPPEFYLTLFLGPLATYGFGVLLGKSGPSPVLVAPAALIILAAAMYCGSVRMTTMPARRFVLLQVAGLVVASAFVYAFDRYWPI